MIHTDSFSSKLDCLSLKVEPTISLTLESTENSERSKNYGNLGDSLREHELKSKKTDTNQDEDESISNIKSEITNEKDVVMQPRSPPLSAYQVSMKYRNPSNPSSQSSLDSLTRSKSPDGKTMLYSAVGSFENLNNSSSYIRDWKSKNTMTRILIPPLKKSTDTSHIHEREHERMTQMNEKGDSDSLLHITDTKPIHLTSEEKETNSDKKSKSVLIKSPTSCITEHDEKIYKKDSNVMKLNANADTDADANADNQPLNRHRRRRKVKKQTKPEVIFCPSSDAYTPRINSKPLSYKPAAERTSQVIPTTMGTISRPNFRDALRRVAMILHQHVVKIEGRFEANGMDPTGLFLPEMRKEFHEGNFARPRYKCTMVRIPMAHSGFVHSLQKLKADYEIPSARIPTEVEIYNFAHQLFKKVQLSSECSIVCLIYVERLMEVSKVPLMACTWRPIFMAGLLLASKVWQDLSSWNIEFASVYPQFSLDSINRLELQFLRMVKWDLYISSRYVSFSYASITFECTLISFSNYW